MKLKKVVRVVQPVPVGVVDLVDPNEIEHEWRVKLTPREANLLETAFPSVQRISQINWILDTPNFELRDRRCLARVRCERLHHQDASDSFNVLPQWTVTIKGPRAKTSHGDEVIRANVEREVSGDLARRVISGEASIYQLLRDSPPALSAKEQKLVASIKGYAKLDRETVVRRLQNKRVVGCLEARIRKRTVLVTVHIDRPESCPEPRVEFEPVVTSTSPDLSARDAERLRTVLHAYLKGVFEIRPANVKGKSRANLAVVARAFRRAG